MGAVLAILALQARPARADARSGERRWGQPHAARAPEVTQAQLRYYSTKPLATARPASAPQDSRWLTIALTITATLAVVAIGSTSVRRPRIRRHRAVISS
jgi:hypothetical protein